MRALPFTSLLPLVSLLYTATAAPTLSSQIPRPSTYPTPNTASHRNVMYVQTFIDDSNQNISLNALVDNQAGATHVILAATHLNNDPSTPILTLNDYAPSSNNYTWLWPQVSNLQSHGIKVMMMLGGSAKGSYAALASDFDKFYAPLHDTLKEHNIDGLDLDIEEDVDINVPLELLRRLNSDFGEDFILTSAPEAAGMVEGGGSLTNFSYIDLDKQATAENKPNGKLLDFYNVQFYNSWGDASSNTQYDSIVSGGFDASRIVMGVLDSHNDGESGFVQLNTLKTVVFSLASKYDNFGGVDGWEYYDAGSSDELQNPWDWIKAIAGAMSGSTSSSKRNVGQQDVKKYPLPCEDEGVYPEALRKLKGKGVEHFEAGQALNRTSGDLEKAKAKLSLL